MAVTPSKQWIHFFLSERWPPTSNILQREKSSDEGRNRTVRVEGKGVAFGRHSTAPDGTNSTTDERHLIPFSTHSKQERTTVSLIVSCVIQAVTGGKCQSERTRTTPGRRRPASALKINGHTHALHVHYNEELNIHCYCTGGILNVKMLYPLLKYTSVHPLLPHKRSDWVRA